MLVAMDDGSRTARAAAGDAAEALVADAPRRGRLDDPRPDVRVGRNELDLVAVDPGPPRTLVVVEVRWRRGATSAWPRRPSITASAPASARPPTTCSSAATCRTCPLRFDLIVVEPGERGADAADPPPPGGVLTARPGVVSRIQAMGAVLGSCWRMWWMAHSATRRSRHRPVAAESSASGRRASSTHDGCRPAGPGGREASRSRRSAAGRVRSGPAGSAEIGRVVESRMSLRPSPPRSGRRGRAASDVSSGPSGAGRERVGRHELARVSAPVLERREPRPTSGSARRIQDERPVGHAGESSAGARRGPCATLRRGPEPVDPGHRQRPPAGDEPSGAHTRTVPTGVVPRPHEGPVPVRSGVRGGTNRQEVAHRAVRFDAAAARGRSPLRPSDPPLESQDAPVHLRRAQRDPHHRPGPDRPAPGRRPRGRPRDRRPWRAGPVRRDQEAGPGADRRRGDPGQHALRPEALARRHADQLHDHQEAHRPARAARGTPARPATSSA